MLTLLLATSTSPIGMTYLSKALDPLNPAPRSTHSSAGPRSSAPLARPQVPQGAPDKILGIAQAFQKCPAPNKVNLVIGAYRDGTGAPWVLPSVRVAEQRLVDKGQNKE